MAGISRRCKRRPNSGIGGCTGNGPGGPPVVYPGTPSYPIPRPPSPYAPPPRGPAAPRVRNNGTTIDIPLNIPIRPITGPAPAKVAITRPIMDGGPQYIDGQQVYTVPASALTLDATISTSDPDANDENVVITISGPNAPILSTDLVFVDIDGSVIQSAVDESYVPALSFDETVVVNESLQTATES
jgi:hypothetical protein